MRIQTVHLLGPWIICNFSLNGTKVAKSHKTFTLFITSVKLCQNRKYLMFVGTDYGHTKARSFAVQIQIPIQNEYLGCGYKGFKVLCRNNGWIMENMDKGLTAHLLRFQQPWILKLIPRKNILFREFTSFS